MAVAAGEFPLPITVRGPRGWAWHGLRLGAEYQILDGEENLLAKVRFEHEKAGSLLGQPDEYSGEALFALSANAGHAAQLLCSARCLGRSGGEIQPFSAPSIATLDSSPSPLPTVEIGFTGTWVTLAGDSIDKPDPLRPAWRFWVQGARFAEAEAVGQREVRLIALDPTRPARIQAPFPLAWLLGIVLTEAASA